MEDTRTNQEGWAIDITTRAKTHYYKHGISLCGKTILKEYMKIHGKELGSKWGGDCNLCIKKQLSPDPLVPVEYFKVTKDNYRFNSNQKVWIELNCANHLAIYYRFRGSGSYSRGYIDKFSPLVGEIKTIEVQSTFAKRIHDEKI